MLLAFKEVISSYTLAADKVRVWSGVCQGGDPCGGRG
jgi:hypothetical protein